MATAGVEQKRPTLTPGVAKVDFSVTTATSQLATSWQPAAVATPFTMAMTGTGMSCIRVITWNTREGELFVRIKLLGLEDKKRRHKKKLTSEHVWNTFVWYSLPWVDVSSFRSCPEENTGPLADNTRRYYKVYTSMFTLNHINSDWITTWYDNNSEIITVDISEDVFSEGLEHGQRQGIPLLGVV